MKPLVTGCICTYNRYDLLPKAIDSLFNQSIDKESYRIIIVDNSPNNKKTLQFKEKYHNPPFVHYLIEETPGLSNARNIALKACETEYIAYMDDDAIASPDWLKNILFGFEAFGPDVAVVGGKVEPIFEIDPPIWLHPSLLSFLSIIDWGGEARIARLNEWFAGTNIAFHVPSLRELGGFDVRLGRIGGGSSLLSNEEIVILRHLRNVGKKVVYVPEASVKHLVERKRLTQEWFRKRVVWQAISDHMSDYEEVTERVKRGWNWVYEYFFKIPPKYRNIKGFYLRTDSAELFRHQLDALYLFTLASLSGFENLRETE